MPRAAGNDPYYTFSLKRGERHDKEVQIKLPSVTHIIGSTVFKPLDGWVYRQTRDSITAMVHAVLQHHDTPTKAADELIDTLLDPDMLAEYLKENRLRPEDVTQDASERGTREHGMLELLAKARMESDETAAEQIATRTIARDATTPWAKAIAGWWLEHYPVVVAGEMVLYSLSLGCAGTVDIITKEDDGYCVTDLKTRGAGKDAYRTDYIQVEGYATMYEEMTGNTVTRTSVLVAREDGTYDEYDSPLDRDAFARTKALYDTLKGVR